MFGTVPSGISTWGRYRKRSPALLFEHDSPETADAAALWSTWFFGTEGTASVTLDDVACEASGTLEIAGQCSATLDDVACAGTGIVADIVHPPTGAVLAVSVLPIRRVTHAAPVRGVSASLPLRTLRRV